MATKVALISERENLARATMGDCQLHLGRYDEAEKTYQVLMQREKSPAVIARLAHLSELQGHPDKAIEQIREAMELSRGFEIGGKELAWYEMRLGHLLMNQGNLTESEKHFRDALSLSSDYSAAQMGLADALAAQGKLDEAETLYTIFVMLKNWLNRLTANSGGSQSDSRRHRRFSRSNSVRSTGAEVLESRQLLTLFVIDTLTDDANDANGVSDGLISLREAITAANSNALFGDAPAGSADGDFIVFQNALIGGMFTLGNGEFAIADDLSIFTGGDSSITIDAGGSSRIFDIDTTGFAGSNHNVTISGLSLINGETVDDGGAVLIGDGENVSISQSTISTNHAAGSGGGIFNLGGVVTVTDTTISDNSASRAGGGIEVTAMSSTTVTASTISGNLAGSNPGNGGGLHITAAGSVTIVDG